MKNLVTFIFLLTIFIAQIKSNPVQKQVVEEPQEHKQEFIEKIKNKAGEIIEDIQEKTDTVVQLAKNSYHQARCNLHQVGEKIYHHEHDHNPYSGGPNHDVNGKIISENTVNNDNKPGVYESKPTGRGYPVANGNNAENILTEETENLYQAGRRLFAPINCPKDFVADKYGRCRERY